MCALCVCGFFCTRLPHPRTSPSPIVDFLPPLRIMMTMTLPRAGKVELSVMLTCSALVIEKTEFGSTKIVCCPIALFTTQLCKEQEDERALPRTKYNQIHLQPTIPINRRLNVELP